MFSPPRNIFYPAKSPNAVIDHFFGSGQTQSRTILLISDDFVASSIFIYRSGIFSILVMDARNWRCGPDVFGRNNHDENCAGSLSRDSKSRRLYANGGTHVGYSVCLAVRYRDAVLHAVLMVVPVQIRREAPDHGRLPLPIWRQDRPFR